MNIAILVGNITRDPELRTTTNGTPVVTFSIAVNRRYKSADGTYPTDFINCVAWRNTAEFISKYFTKGSKIGIKGTIQSRSYDDQNGQKKYVTEVLVDDAEFVTSKSQNPASVDNYGVPPQTAAPAAAPPPQTQAQKADELFAEELTEFKPLDDAELPF